MKTILAACDFSSASKNAATYAADLASAMGARLVMINVCAVPIAYTDIPAALSIENVIARAQEEFSPLCRELKELHPALEITTEVKTGGVITEIEDYCKEIKPWLVLMGSHGSNAVERVLFGSSTLSAVKRLSWPLIIVPPKAQFSGINKIGLACDMQNVIATFPLKQIKSFVKDFAAKLFVLHVTEPVYSTEVIDESGELQEVLDELQPAYHFLDYENVGDGLDHFAKQQSIDLLVVVPKAHHFIEGLFHKSQSKQIVLHSHLPVMIMHKID